MAGAVGKLEAAFGATRTTDPAAMTWTDLSARTQENETTIRQGRSSGGAASAQPGGFGQVLDNEDGALTPRNPDSTYHPEVVRGTPLRWTAVGVEQPYLLCDGTAGASTPDHASLDVTGDMAVAVEFLSPMRVPLTGELEVMGKYVAAGNQRSWLLYIDFDGTVILQWDEAGTGVTVKLAWTDTSVPRPDAGPLTVAAELDVNDGAGGHVVRFYVCKGTLADLLADKAAFLFTTWQGTGTTSIFAGTAPLEVAFLSGATTSPYTGKVRKALLCSGTLDGGSQVANPDFTAQAVGAGSFTDAAGRTWTVGSDIEANSVRMVGELASNAPDWPGASSGGARVRWEAAGILRRLRQGQAPLKSALYRAVMSGRTVNDVVAYWPMEDGSDATVIASPIAGVRPMKFDRTNMRLAADSGFTSSQPLPQVGLNGYLRYWGTVPKPSATPTSWRIDHFVFIESNTASATNESILWVYTSGTVALWRITINSTTYAVVGEDKDGATVVNSTNPVDSRFFNVWMLVSLELTQDGADIDFTLTLVPLPAGIGFGITGTEAASTLGNITKVGAANNAVAFADGYSFGHLIVSVDTALGWLAPADTAFTGEPAAQRFARLCIEEGVGQIVNGPHGFSWDPVLALGGTRMGPQRPLPLLALLEECAVADNALLAESRELLALTYRPGVALENQTEALAVTPLAEGFAPADDDQTMVNDVTVKRPAGSSARAVDDTSVALHGRYEASREANVSDDLHLPSQATWWLHEANTDEMRYPGVTVELGKAGAPLTDWLHTNLGDVVLVENLPAEHPTDEVRQLVEGYTERISPSRWGVDANGTPAAPWDIGVRDTARRDTAGSHLENSYDAGTDTSIDVVVESEPAWTTAAGDFPFDVWIDGAQVHVTAIGALSAGVQTFTVDAATLNGVTRTIPAGRAVRLWTPAYRSF